MSYSTVTKKTYQKKGQKKPQYKYVAKNQKGYMRNVGFYGRYTGPRPELKFFDTSLSFGTDATPEIPATGQLSLIPQGDTESTRVGKNCVIRSIQIVGSLTQVPSASATTGDIFYMYLVQDTQCNGSAATVDDPNSGVITTLGNNLNSALVCLANSQRFKILKKWIIEFNTGSGVTTAYNTTCKKINFYKKCNIPMVFDASATTGAITTIRSNNLFLISGTSGQTDDIIFMTGACRLRFSDS